MCHELGTLGFWCAVRNWWTLVDSTDMGAQVILPRYAYPKWHRVSVNGLARISNLLIKKVLPWSAMKLEHIA